MKPYPKRIDIYRGDYFEESFRIRERQWNAALNGGLGGWESGGYLDLTGWSGAWQIRKTVDDQAVMGTGVVTIADQNTKPGLVTYAMEGDQTELLSVGEQRFDVQLTDPNGKPRTFLAGPAVVDGDVTRV